MRSRTPLTFALFFVGSSVAFLPHVALAASLPYFGPIVPTAANACPAAWGLLIEVINNIMRVALSLVIVFIAPIMIAYAGFLLVTNAGNSGQISKARTLLTNTIVGIVIALAAWMIVGAIMTALTGKDVSYWTSLIGGNGAAECIPLTAALPIGDNGTPQTGVNSDGSTNTPPSSMVGTVCDPNYLLTLEPRLTTVQANIFACIAAPESGCNAAPAPPNYAWDKGVPGKPGSTAAGAFQVLLSSNHAMYENANCYAAAGLPADGSVKLSCERGFDSNGNPKKDAAGAAIANRCLQAANHAGCSIAAADALLTANGGSFRAWQTDSHSSRQSQCINTGGTSGGA